MRNAWAVVAMIMLGCGPSASRPPGTGDPVDGATGPIVDAAACATETAAASTVIRPVDIIWVIDNSGSMDAEEARVQSNMNGFASSIAASGTDYHVIVINDTSHVNVPPPLGGSPELLNVNVNIDSHNALENLVAAYPTYQSFLRPTSVKHIVVVSDDESGWSKATFESQLGALTAPGFGTGWRLHAVVAESPPYIQGHCFLLSAAAGSTYISLQTAHNGTFFSLCETNWSPLFATLAQSVTQGLALPCTFSIPAPTSGQSIDPTHVNFVYTPTNGQPQTIANARPAARCNGGPGPYYDNPAPPTEILTCPATCSTLGSDPGGTVSVQFGCATVIQ